MTTNKIVPSFPAFKRGETVVELPSAVIPGTTFLAVTSEEIRLRNHRRWLITQDKYRTRKGADDMFTVMSVMNRRTE